MILKNMLLLILISAFIWASITIIPSYIFGEEILSLLKWLKEHWYIGISFAGFILFLLWYINYKEDKKRRMRWSLLREKVR